MLGRRPRLLLVPMLPKIEWSSGFLDVFFRLGCVLPTTALHKNTSESVERESEETTRNIAMKIEVFLELLKVMT